MISAPDIDRTSSTSSADQVLSDAAMPYRQTFFPLGFPVEVITNCPDVLEAAAQSWSMFQSRFDTVPLTIKLGVTSNPDASSSLPPAPVCRVQGHLATHIADRYNFISCDLETGFSFGWVTEQTVMSPLYLRYHLLEAAALCMLAGTRVSALHSACVTVNGFGMLLSGDSGVGKSSLAFAGARSGWTFTSDDASYLLLNRNDHMVVGNCHQFRLRDSGALLFPELEGRSITPRAAGKPSLEIPSTELSGIRTSESAVIRAIVFLNRRDIATSELCPFPNDIARRWFHQFHFANTTSSAQQLSAVDHLLDLPVFELRYNDLDWAITRLNLLSQQGV